MALFRILGYKTLKLYPRRIVKDNRHKQGQNELNNSANLNTKISLV